MGSAHLSAEDEIRLAELDSRILTLKKHGYTFQAIADAEELSKAYVWKRYARALRRITEPAVQEYRAAQLVQIESERELLHEILHAAHPVVQQGHQVSEITGHWPACTEDGDEHPLAGQPIYGDPLHDDGPVLAALDRLAKLRAQEMDLLGLRAPTKVELAAQVAYTVAGVDPAVLR